MPTCKDQQEDLPMKGNGLIGRISTSVAGFALGAYAVAFLINTAQWL
jgi:hypothetical protein